MRLPNGFGSVYKMKGDLRKPWIARKTIGWTDYGQQQYYVIGHFKTKAEGVKALADFNNDELGERRNIALADIYLEWYDMRFVHSNKKYSSKTIESYEVAWKHLEPIENEPIKNIKASHIQKIINEMTSVKKLSYSSCHKVKVLAGLLFKYAMADDIINKNYATFVELPRNSRKEPEIFNSKEIQMLEDNADTLEWADTILIFIYTGLRISELLTLKKENVDLDNMVITGGLKTDAGRNRIIPIHPNIQKYIKRWYNKDASTNYLISRNGEMINTNYYRSSLYYPILKELGIRKLTPHTTRHTFATLLNKAGADTLSIQKLIGHADYSTTANIYTHPEIEELKSAIEKI